LFLRQSFPLPGATNFPVDDGLNQVEGFLPDSRITINIGKFSLPDFFDYNSYNHDARSQFLNWALMGQGAWDYAADTRGYTSGIEIELVKPAWQLRYAFVQMQKTANYIDMDMDMLRTHGQCIEYARQSPVKKHPGFFTLNFFRNTSGAPYYADATNLMRHGDYSLVPIIAGQVATPLSGHNKWGFGINL